MQMRKFALALLASLLWQGAALAGPVLKTVEAGSADVSVAVRIIDSTDGTPETGVAFNESGIDLEYWIHGANAVVDITEATQTINGAHSDGGFVEIGHGMYRLDLPDAAVASADVEVYGTITGMIVIGGTVQVVGYDPTDGVRMGMTALPNAAADAAGGLPTSDAGGLDLDALNVNVNDIETDTAVIGAAGAGLTAVSIATNGIAAGDIAAGAINAAAIANNAIDAATFAADVDAEVLSYLVDDATKIDASELNADIDSLTFTVAGDVDANTQTIEGGDATDAINAADDAAIETYHLDHLLAADYDPSSPPGTATALLNELVENDGGVSRFTVNSLENAPSGSGASAEAIVDEWETQSQADPTGFHVNVIEVGGTTQTANDNGADINAILVDTSTTLDDLVDDLETRLTAARAGYLDNLSAGAVALASGVDITSISGDSTAADNLEALLDLNVNVTNGALPSFGIIASGTAQAYTAGTPSVTLASATAAADDDFNGATLLVWGSNEGDIQSATISDYAGSTDIATIDAALATAPTGTISYVIFGTAEGSAGGGDATAANQTTILTRLGTPGDLGGGATVADNLSDIEGQTDDIGVAGVGLTGVSIATGGIAAGDIGANAITDAAVANDVQVDLATIETVDATDALDTAADTVTVTAVSAGAIDDAAVDDDALGDGTALTEAGGTGDQFTAADDAVMTRLGAPAGASIAADIAEIEGQTDDIGVAGAGLTAADDAVAALLGSPAGASVSADIAAAKADTAATLVDTGTTLPGLIGTPSADLAADIAALPTAAENSTQVLTDQRVITGTCDSGTTTTCVDDALTQAAEAQLDDRLICFDDSWCALITGFTPGTDTVTTTKTAPSSRGSLDYTIYPATAQ